MQETLASWQLDALEEGGYTVKYALSVPRFMLGIDAIRKASRTMREVFDGYVPDDPDSKDGRNNAYSTALACFALLDTISMLPPDDYDGPLSKCRVLDIYYGKANYIDEDGICVNWEHMKSPDNESNEESWVFWLLLPNNKFVEPGATGPLAAELRKQGFVEEAFTV